MLFIIVLNVLRIVIYPSLDILRIVSTLTIKTKEVLNSNSTLYKEVRILRNNKIVLG
jgi:hypothetical protein